MHLHPQLKPAAQVCRSCLGLRTCTTLQYQTVEQWQVGTCSVRIPEFHPPSCWAEGGTLWKAEESLGDGARLVEEGPWGHTFEVTPTPGPRLDSSASFLQPCEPSMALGSATRVTASTFCPFLVGLIAPKPVSPKIPSPLFLWMCVWCAGK